MGEEVMEPGRILTHIQKVKLFVCFAFIHCKVLLANQHCHTCLLILRITLWLKSTDYIGSEKI